MNVPLTILGFIFYVLVYAMSCYWQTPYVHLHTISCELYMK